MISLANYCMCVLTDSGVVLLSSRDSLYSSSSGNNASTNPTASNDCKSCIDSPTPTNLTGIPNSSTTLTTAPPREVPSSLVKMIPVTPTASLKTRAWLSMFNPVVPSKTSKTSCGALGKRLEMEFFTPTNSSMS